jgi:uncharacterized protein YjbI with pentapeptide repeats
VGGFGILGTGQDTFAASKIKNRMMLQSNSIGGKIAAARKKANLSQGELARQVLISAQAVGKWERGESMPDITTLNRLAELLGVDLNYFSERFPSIEAADGGPGSVTIQASASRGAEQKGNLDWDMSSLNLVDSDFSGVKNLHEKFSSSNMQRCLFVGSHMAGLLLNSNTIDDCDFTDSDISSSRIKESSLGNTKFKNCSLKETEISGCDIRACDFSGADFTKAAFRSGNFAKNAVANARWTGTSFVDMHIRDIVFEGILDGCFFENCAFSGVKFQHATLQNTFFKNNRKMKRVQFVDCMVDKITYAFLKSNQANLEGITVMA